MKFEWVKSLSIHLMHVWISLYKYNSLGVSPMFFKGAHNGRLFVVCVDFILWIEVLIEPFYAYMDKLL